MNLFKDLMKNSRGLRRLGSAAVDLAYVACGRFDAFYEYSLHPWDVAAGSFIVQQAGGKVADFKGADDYLFGKEIITCNPHIYAELLEKVKLHFNYLN
jgi:myo-inositol-1(or 4)-monophosphatase